MAVEDVISQPPWVPTYVGNAGVWGAGMSKQRSSHGISIFADHLQYPYIPQMLRAMTSLLWIIAALALGFEAVAEPCDMRAEMEAPSHHELMADMPCHDMMMNAPSPSDEAPDHTSQACCCAALLGNGVTADAPELNQPVPGLTLWAMPLPDSATSILFEYEPPPPRA